WRRVVVPDAAQFSLGHSALSNLADTLRWVVSLTGTSDPTSPVFAGVALVAVVAAGWLPSAPRRRAAIWLLCTALACGVVSLGARMNLLVIPTVFYGLLLGEVAAGVARRGRIAAVATTGVLLLASVLGLRASAIEQRSMHPLSAEQIY